MGIHEQLTSCRAFHHASYPSSENLNATQRALVAEFNRRLATGDLATEDVPCLCGGTDFALVAAFDRYRIAQRTLACRACGLIQSNPRMTEEATDDFYGSDTYRSLYNPHVFAMDQAMFEGYVARSAYRHAFITRVLSDHEIASVLEIGCGGGWNVWPFYEDGVQIVGYDLGPALIAFGKSMGLDLRVGSIDDVSGAYDIIVLSHVVEHFLDPVSMVRKIASHLSPNGHLYIEVPNAEGFCLGSLQNAHTYFFSPNTLRHYMGMAGLTEVAADRFGPHYGALFCKGQGVTNALTGEYERISTIIKRYDRRERTKDAMNRLGILPLARAVLKRLR